MTLTIGESYFSYSDALRKSGTVNMWGASIYLVKEFGPNEKDARIVLGNWMKTFEERHKGDKL